MVKISYTAKEMFIHNKLSELYIRFCFKVTPRVMLKPEHKMRYYILIDPKGNCLPENLREIIIY